MFTEIIVRILDIHQYKEDTYQITKVNVSTIKNILHYNYFKYIRTCTFGEFYIIGNNYSSLWPVSFKKTMIVRKTCNITGIAYNIGKKSIACRLRYMNQISVNTFNPSCFVLNTHIGNITC